MLVNAMDDSPIIIIGMGSSGTRLIVSVLERLGVFMGGSLLNNEFREPSIFYQTAHAFVDEFRYFDPLPKNWPLIVQRHTPELKNFIYNILPVEYQKAGYNGGPWGFKDPRTLFVLPVYLSVFPLSRVLHCVRDGRDVALTKIKERWPSLTNTASLDRWFRVWESNVEIAASYQSSVKLGNFAEVRYEDVCHLAEPAVTSVARLTNSDPDAVRQAIRQLARTDRLAKWNQQSDNFTFASSSKILRAYGYSSA